MLSTRNTLSVVKFCRSLFKQGTEQNTRETNGSVVNKKVVNRSYRSLAELHEKEGREGWTGRRMCER